jgi:hypothetical protein
MFLLAAIQKDIKLHSIKLKNCRQFCTLPLLKPQLSRLNKEPLEKKVQDVPIYPADRINLWRDKVPDI